MLVLNERLGAAFFLAVLASVFKDAALMPFFGMVTASKVLTVFAIKFICDHFYRENYIARVFILTAGAAANCLIYAVVVWLFYWRFKYHFVPVQSVWQFVLTALAGALVLKAAELYMTEGKRWLKMISGKI
jgi:hypothetical protein